MSQHNLRAQYRSIQSDPFPTTIRLSFGEESFGSDIVFEKVEWMVDGETRGLRYGENPHQEAALYRPVNGNVAIAGVEYILPGNGLVTDAELIHSGKHPSKINITDVDSALGILAHLEKAPTTVIVKHNNPCGAAQKDTLRESYLAAFEADSVAAFGGAVVCNREVDAETAEEIASRYTEVVAAPAYAEGSLEILGKKKNLRVLRIRRMDRLGEYLSMPYVDMHSLMDGGVVMQRSYHTRIQGVDDFIPAEATSKGTTYRCSREATPEELEDLLFGWRIETGITSNSVLYVKNRTTVGIGTGEQDRVGVAEIAARKAKRNGEASLKGAVMVSDGFFPFRDGVEVGLREGVTAVAQPGGSVRDREVIEACNEYSAAMVFTGERSFRH